MDRAGHSTGATGLVRLGIRREAAQTVAVWTRCPPAAHDEEVTATPDHAPGNAPAAGAPPAVAVRPCAHSDVEVLEAAIPSPGTSRFHEQRFAEQRSGRSSYLVAWLGGHPVGHLNLRWVGSVLPEVVRVVRGAPEINALGVSPPEMRNRGIGTALIGDAESRAAARGARRICLAVAVENTAAARLYERLGYEDWGRGTVTSTWSYRDDAGRPVVQHETVCYLVKPLK
jgi:ribosomal protein S18 acetylase RimI-like enzyme